MKLMMVGMSKKTHRGKLTSRAPETLKSRVRTWIATVASAHYEMGRRLNIEDTIAAAILDFMELEPREREGRLSLRLVQLKAMYDAEAAGSIPPDRGPAENPGFILDLARDRDEPDGDPDHDPPERRRTPKRRA